MRVFVLGLRRSGTTIFWSTLKQDSRFNAAFNEPYNPLIRLVGPSAWYRSLHRYYDVYHQLLQRDGADFWQTLAPIQGLEELQEGFSDRQSRYLEYLLAAGENSLMEATRCHYKVADLRRLAGPEAVLVHLYRRPESFATSHLLPSGQTVQDTDWSPLKRQYLMANFRLKKAYYQRTFWTRRRRFDNWGMETVMAADNSDSLFACRCREEGLDPEEIYALPAVGRLLALWRVFFQRLERDGAEQFGPRFVSLAFEDFCRAPGQSLRRIYDVLGEEMPAFQLDRIHPSVPPFQADNPLWTRYLSAAGI